MDSLRVIGLHVLALAVLLLLAPSVAAFRFEPVSGTVIYVLDVENSGGSTYTTTGVESGGIPLLLVQRDQPYVCGTDTGSITWFYVFAPAHGATVMLGQIRGTGFCSPPGQENFAYVSAGGIAWGQSIYVEDVSTDPDFVTITSGESYFTSSWSVIGVGDGNTQGGVDRGTGQAWAAGLHETWPVFRIQQFWIDASASGGACPAPMVAGYVGVSETHGPTSPWGSNTICV